MPWRHQSGSGWGIVYHSFRSLLTSDRKALLEAYNRISLFNRSCWRSWLNLQSPSTIILFSTRFRQPIPSGESAWTTEFASARSPAQNSWWRSLEAPLHAGRDPDPLRPRISRDSPISHEDSIHEDFKALYIHILYYRLISIKFIK